MSVSGFADLPLHMGHVPPWLYSRMVKLSGLIVELLVDEHGIRDTIKLFSNPLFFQAFNNIIGMDWDSSGSTTITTAALKEALSKKDIGIKVVGGKGGFTQLIRPLKLRSWVGFGMLMLRGLSLCLGFLLRLIIRRCRTVIGFITMQ